MPRLRRTKVDAFRQLADLEKHDDPEHFATALGARSTTGGVLDQSGTKRRTLTLFDR